MHTKAFIGSLVNLSLLSGPAPSPKGILALEKTILLLVLGKRIKQEKINNFLSEIPWCKTCNYAKPELVVATSQT
jgi:hypothetical protein